MVWKDQVVNVEDVVEGDGMDEGIVWDVVVHVDDFSKVN